MDEFGSRVRQSCDPTVAMTVFFYIPSQLAFTAMWPLKNLSCGGTVVEHWYFSDFDGNILFGGPGMTISEMHSVAL